MPISLPIEPLARELTWLPISRVAVASSPLTGAQQVYAHAGQWWELTFELPPLSAAQSGAWVGALLRLNGRAGTFYFAPTDATPQEAVSGTITVDAISDDYLDLSGMTGRFNPGDWIQIGAGLYRVATGDTAVAGEATIQVWPKPRADVQAGVSTVNYTAPQGTFRLLDAPSFDMDEARMYGISLAAREVL